MLEVCSFIASLEEVRILAGLLLGLIINLFKRERSGYNKTIENYSYRLEIIYWIGTIGIAFVWSFFTDNFITRVITKTFVPLQDEYKMVQFLVAMVFGYSGLVVVPKILDKIQSKARTIIDEKIESL